MVLLNQSYSYEEIINHMKVLEKKYPQILSRQLIGTTSDRRLVVSLILGKGTKTLVCTGGVHGRESVNPVVLLKMIEYYCECYDDKKKISDLSIFELLNTYCIVWIPLMNPDGYEVARKGFGMLKNPCFRQAAKMRGIPFAEWKYNARGVDINRNFPCKHYKPLFPGDKPGSEPETSMLIQVFDEFETIGYFDFHSRGKLIYYYRSSLPEEYNQEQKKLASYLSSLCDYTIGEPEEEMADASSGGNTVQYYAQTYQKAAITIETVADEEEFPLNVGLQKEAFNEIMQLPAAFLQWHAENLEHP